MGHDHSHGGGHHHHHSHGTGKKLIFACIVILLFSIVEAFGGWWANSLALLGDAGHMFADSFALGFAAVAAWIAQKPPSERLSFGYGRAEVIAGTLTSLLLVAIVVAISVEAIVRLVEGESHVNGIIIMVIAGIGFLANVVVAIVLSFGEKNLNVRAAILHVLSDLLGSVAAIIAGIVIYLTGWMPIDAILSLFICVLIAIATYHLLKEALHILMEGVPSQINLDELGNHLASIEGVESVHDLHIWNLSSSNIMLTAHVCLNSFAAWPQSLAFIESILKRTYKISHVTIQPEINEYPVVFINQEKKPNEN
jgi:cobalt-zinc-cadmium efflux system protein